MKSQELPIKQTMNVILKPDTETLEEVVVLGYGSGKKIGSIVGSVAKVNSEKLSAKPVANAMDALQGQVSGLQVYTSSGEPGSSSSSYIRGVGSLTADNEPLYVLDGTPVSSSVMVMMNPNDFESVTVLKDASATSIYGSRAANGVIYITTKRGKIGEKAVITASGNYGTARLARRVSNPMNSTELLNYQLSHGIIKQETYDKYINSGIDTNWEDYFFKDDAPTYQANLSIQGGSNKTMYYVSGSYYFQDGITPRSEYNRYTFRSNLESRPTDWLRFGANFGATYDEQQTSLFTYQGSNNLNGGIFGTILNPTYYNPYGEDGSKLDVIPGLNRYSPYYLSDKQPSSSNTAQLDGTAFIQLNPIEGLTIRSQFGIEAYDFRQTSKRLASHPNATQGGYTYEAFRRNAKLTITNTAEYNFKIKDIHEAGKYTVVAVTYNENEEVQLHNALIFDFEPAGKPNPWVSLGNCGYTDDFVFTSYFETESADDVASYPVEIYENKEQPGMFRLQNPYGPESFYGEVEGAVFADGNHNIVINATDPEGVYIELQSTGLDLGDAEIGIYSMAGYYLDEGKTLEEVKVAGVCGTYKNNIITFPKEALAIVLGEKMYKANIYGAWKIDMNALQKTNRSVSTFNWNSLQKSVFAGNSLMSVPDYRIMHVRGQKVDTQRVVKVRNFKY